MSRNIGSCNCDYCGHTVSVLEAPRQLTRSEAGVYYDQFSTRLFANAECPICLAQYLAWVDGGTGREGESVVVSDLSYRYSFNDEPNERDLPRYEVERLWVRTRLLPEHDYARLGPVKV